MHRLALVLFSLSVFFISFFVMIHRSSPLMETGESEESEQPKAMEALDWWYDQRALPGRMIPPEGLMNAFVQTQKSLQRFTKRTAEEPWSSIGPDNIGGRMLSLAFDPDSTNILWAGSASGGLWKSTTGGAGAAAWQFINTGFTVLSVSSIAIDPSNSAVMYIGTGEISGYELGLVGTPGARTTYGLGILKSTDKGKSWNTTGLTWLFSQNRSVQRIVLNPQNPRTIFAATSEGTYRSLNGGTTFTRVDSTLMAMDVAIDPVDTTIVFIACGQRNTAPNPGLYRSKNGGTSFTKMAGGLPASNIGRTCLAIAPSLHTTLYASIANATTHATLGVYRSTNSGDTWESMSTVDFMNGQGWYDNVAAVSPANPALLFTSGLDIYRSTTGGSSPVQRSYWYKGNSGVIAPGGVEGSDNSYVHADHHAIVFDPENPARIFFASDGGIFESTDGGDTFTGRNGGLVTTQFYNGFAHTSNDSLIALGGLQDNGTVKFTGGRSWNKVYGGDGGWCAIDPSNKNVMYEEYVNLAIAKSTDGGSSWSSVFSPASSDSANFIAPFVIAPSNGQILYAGAEKVHKSTNGGTTWTATNGNTALNSVSLSCLAVSWTSPDTVIAGTGKRTFPLFELFYTTNGGTSWSKSLSLLPNRFPTDLAFDPTDSRIAYATFSGYGSPHVYRSSDAGKTWTNISADLPDLPVQSVCVDPLNPSDIYLGTDLGVYRSLNNGTSWEPWFDGMPYAMVLDVVVSLPDHRLRAATFGNGVYQRKLRPKQTLAVKSDGVGIPSRTELGQNYPNPFNPETAIPVRLAAAAHATVAVFDAAGRLVEKIVEGEMPAGTTVVRWNAARYSSGTYFVRLTTTSLVQTKKMLLQR